MNEATRPPANIVKRDRHVLVYCTYGKFISEALTPEKEELMQRWILTEGSPSAFSLRLKSGSILLLTAAVAASSMFIFGFLEEE